MVKENFVPKIEKQTSPEKESKAAFIKTSDAELSEILSGMKKNSLYSGMINSLEAFLIELKKPKPSKKELVRLSDEYLKRNWAIPKPVPEDEKNTFEKAEKLYDKVYGQYIETP